MNMFLVGGVAVFLILLLGAYNGLVGKRNQVDNIFATVDALLKKRFDLVPNLIASVQQYMKHEAQTLTDITRLRSTGLPDADIAASNQLDRTLRSIRINMEAYPQLRASENFQNLDRSLNEIEEQLSAGRRAFNAAVTDYNNACDMIPTNIVAGLFGFKRRALFEITAAERANPDVKSLFKTP